MTWDNVWVPATEGDAFIKPESFPEDSYRKDAAPIYDVRNAFAMWHKYLPENVWLNKLYPLNTEGVDTLQERFEG